ncbi:MAG: C10 family peptidase [Tannerellaceae bacterium]|nr:C10 family peptidase [Tannerellaceae bacterium]
MRNHLTCILTIMFVVCSCDSVLNEDYQEKEKEKSQRFPVCTEPKVTVEEINHYLRNNPLTRSATTEIEPIIYKEDTLLYILNYGNGWEILSEDKRAPMILAFSEEGYLDLYNNSPGFYIWLNENAEAIYKLKKDVDNADSPYIAEWEKALGQVIQTSGVGGDNGYWEVIDIQNEEQITEYPRLTKTEWGQSGNWNACVPYAKDMSERCVAGCVAVAGAQMLYYLHYYLGVPEKMFSSGICVGTENNYQFNFSIPSSTIWDQMARTASDDISKQYNSAILIGYVGDVVGISYGKNESSGKTENLVKVFSDLGISCKHSSFDGPTVINSIKNNIPVILSAQADKTNWFLGLIITYDKGHSFIADGYQERKVTTTRKFRWISTGGPGVVDPNDRDENGNIVGGEEKTERTVSIYHYIV